MQPARTVKTKLKHAGENAQPPALCLLPQVMLWFGEMGTTRSPPVRAAAGAAGAASALLARKTATPRRRPPEEIAVCINNPHGLKAEGLERLRDPRDWDGAELPFISQPLPALLQSLEVVLSWLFLKN